MICCGSKRRSRRNTRVVNLRQAEIDQLVLKRSKYIEDQEAYELQKSPGFPWPYERRRRFNKLQFLDMVKIFRAICEEKVDGIKRTEFVKKFSMSNNPSSMDLLGRIYDVLVKKQNELQLEQGIRQDLMSLNNFLDYFEVIQIGLDIHKMVLSFDILDGPDDNNTITRVNFLDVTRLMCGINSYLTRTKYDESQVETIVEFLIASIDRDQDHEIDIIEFYEYYKNNKNSEEFFQLLYGKGIESLIGSKGKIGKQRQNRVQLLGIYKKLVIYSQYYKMYLLEDRRNGHVYPVIHDKTVEDFVIDDQEIETYNQFQSRYSVVMLNAMKTKFDHDIAVPKVNFPKDQILNSGRFNTTIIQKKPGVHYGDVPLVQTEKNSLYEGSGLLTYEEAQIYFIQLLDQSLEIFLSLIKSIIKEYDQDKKYIEEEAELPDQIIQENKIRNQKKIKDKTPGKDIYLWDQGWDVVVGIMLGLGRTISTGGYLSNQVQDNIPLDYRYEINSFTFELPNSMGEKSCVFKDYAPNLFAKIRETCNINPEVYLASIGPSKLVSSLLGGDTSTLSELMSPGKSGSFLYFTYDGNYLLKAILPKEFVFFKRTVVRYYNYIIQHPKSLIARYLGLHKMKISNNGKMSVYYLVVMRNIFKTKKQLDLRFDLKGSTHGRETHI